MLQPKTLIAKRLKDAMDERGLNTAELARVADVKKTFLYDVLSGKSLHPSSVTLSKVAEVFGLPVTYFTGTSTQAPAPQTASISPYVILPPLADATIDEFSFRRSWLNTAFDCGTERLRIAHIKGDAMAPTLHEGDVVMVDTSDTHPTLPGIYMIAQGKMAQPKRLEMIKKNIHVSSDNPAYKSFSASAEDLEILGRVVWISRKI